MHANGVYAQEICEPHALRIAPSARVGNHNCTRERIGYRSRFADSPSGVNFRSGKVSFRRPVHMTWRHVVWIAPGSGDSGASPIARLSSAGSSVRQRAGSTPAVFRFDGWTGGAGIRGERETYLRGQGQHGKRALPEGRVVGMSDQRRTGQRTVPSLCSGNRAEAAWRRCFAKGIVTTPDSGAQSLTRPRALSAPGASGVSSRDTERRS